MEIDHNTFAALEQESRSGQESPSAKWASLVIDEAANSDYWGEFSKRLVAPHCIPTIWQMLEFHDLIEQGQPTPQVEYDPLRVDPMNESRWRQLAALEQDGHALILSQEEKDVLLKLRRNWVRRILDHASDNMDGEAWDFNTHPEYLTVHLLDEETQDSMTVCVIRRSEFLQDPNYEAFYDVPGGWITSTDDIDDDGNWTRVSEINHGDTHE